MKTYRQYCGIAKALDLIGQRWSMLILRELLLGPRRYSEIHRSLDGITTNLLAKRMRELERADLVERVRRASDGRQAWALTEVGESVKPALLELGRFGARWMVAPDGDRVSDRWFMVSVQRRYTGSMPRTTGGVCFGDRWYAVEIDGPELTASDGAPASADFTVEGPPLAVVAALSGRGAEGVRVTGDRSRFDDLVAALAAP